LDQFSPGATTWIVRTGEIIECIFIDKPGISNFIGGQVALTAKPFNGFRVHFESPARFQDAKIVL
jgi:hypothetical protein